MIISDPIFISQKSPAECWQTDSIYIIKNIKPRTITCTFIVCVFLILILIPVINDLALYSESNVCVGIAFGLIVALVAIAISLPGNISHKANGNVPSGHEPIAVIGATVIGALISLGMTSVLTEVLFSNSGISAETAGGFSANLIAGTVIGIFLFPFVFCIPTDVIKPNVSMIRLLRALRLLLKGKYFTRVVAIIFVSALVMPLIPSYGLTSDEVDPRVIENMSTPSGVLSGELLLEKEGELSFEYGILSSEEVLTGDVSASVYIGKDQIDHGLIYLKVSGADESKLKIILVPKNFIADSRNMRPYGEGYYPLIHGSGEYLCIVLAEQNDGTYTEAFRTEFLAEFDANDPYSYSNAFSVYSEESTLAKKAYELTYKLDDRDAMAKRIRDYLKWNFRYSYDSDGVHELVDNDEIYKKGEGLCYHYASLYSSMMKSIGIPTREVRGYIYDGDSKYHAWNEYLNENNEWIPIDATGVLQESGYKYIKMEFSER